MNNSKNQPKTQPLHNKRSQKIKQSKTILGTENFSPINNQDVKENFENNVATQDFGRRESISPEKKFNNDIKTPQDGYKAVYEFYKDDEKKFR